MAANVVGVRGLPRTGATLLCQLLAQIRDAWRHGVETPLQRVQQARSA